MEFLKTCSTNAQAVGDYEAIAYQAFSVRDLASSDALCAAEAELRRDRRFVTHDASRPWLWHFEPVALDAVGQDTLKLPSLARYNLHREQHGYMKASDMARPPLRVGALNSLPHTHLATTPASTSPLAKVEPGERKAASAHQHPALDYFAIYELFVSSVTALISYCLVSNSGVVALGFRTFVTKPVLQSESEYPQSNYSGSPLWLTGINVHWVSAGTLLISTATERHSNITCLDALLPEDEGPTVGKCIRVAPNGMLARVSSFQDPLEAPTNDTARKWPRNKAKTTAEQAVQKWKSSVERWLSWKGYSIPHLDSPNAWVRIRIAQAAQSPPTSSSSTTAERHVLWPRALCFIHDAEPSHKESSVGLGGRTPPSDLRWFETSVSKGPTDPTDVAQEWFLGKLDRDKILDARRKTKKAEEDAIRRKDEPPGLFPSSPFNARTGTYGDLQAVSGVYPTPPDGIAPGLGLSSTNTPSVSGANANIVLVPGGTTPAINLSAPQDQHHTEEPSTSPAFPTTSEAFHTSGDDDDLFEDMVGETYGAIGVNDADFDFFDGPDDDDVDMADAPALPQPDEGHQTKHSPNNNANPRPASATKQEMSDPLAALENALASPPQPVDDKMTDVDSEPPQKMKALLHRAAKPGAAVQLASPPANEHAHVKEPTPPLTSDAIAKSLQPSPPQKAASEKNNILAPHALPKSSFHPLDFSHTLNLVDAKYQEGRFAAPIEDEVDGKLDQDAAIAPPIRSLRDLPLLTKLRHAIGIASAAKLPEVPALARAASDDSDSDVESEISDASAEEEDSGDTAGFKPPYLGRLVIPAKRKLPTEGHGTPMSATSFADSFAGDWQEFSGLQLEEATLSSFEPSTWDWRMVDLPAPTERPSIGARYVVPALPPPSTELPDTPTSQPDLSSSLPDEKPTSGKDIIAITQIVTDQIVLSTFDLLGEDESPMPASIPAAAETHWLSTLKQVFPKAIDCSVNALIAVNDVFPDAQTLSKAQQRPLPRKPNENSAVPGNHMWLMNPPFIRVRRAETHWDLLPPSIAFWEPLGLAPVSPAKNVVAFCIYPHSDTLRPTLERFMLNLQLAYDTCKLGTHARVDAIPEYEGGLVPCRVDSPDSLKAAFRALKDTCVQLGKQLASHHAQIQEQQDTKIDAFVVYMVDPFGIPAALWELCSAFWTLFQAYGQGPQARPDTPQKPDLVLQVLPIKCLASFDVPIIPDPSTYVNLAREVYDRCPPSAASTEKTPLSIYKAPAFQLEESLPRNIQFKLVSEPPQDLLRENSYMHIAYAISLDGTWITAAWTDNCGKSQAVVSYHLGTRPFSDIAKEIWHTTIDILSSRHVQWRVCIAKYGAMERDELDTWVLLVQVPTQVHLFLTLLTVLDDAPYRFTPPYAPTAAATTSTPTSTTPQPGPSPAGLTPAATPAPDAPDPSADPDARLVDPSDETIGIILAHRLHNSPSSPHFSPALISGLIVKTCPSPSFSHAPISSAINILWIGAVNPAAHSNNEPSSLMWTPTPPTRATAENLLREVMGQYRGLGLLGRLRGVRGVGCGCLPWHVGVVKSGVGGLGRVCGWRV